MTEVSSEFMPPHPDQPLGTANIQWPQFSLRSMLIVVAAIALLVAQYPFVDVITIYYGQYPDRIPLPSWRLLTVMIVEALLATGWLIWCRPRWWRVWAVVLGIWGILIVGLITPWVLLAILS